MTEISTLEQAAKARLSRRRFVGIAGALAGAGLIAGATGCTKEEEDPGLNLGAGDTGRLNTFFTLKQLSADFYTRVAANAASGQFGGLSALEREYFQSIRNHEIAHRELLKNLLQGGEREELEFDYSSIDFAKRTSLIDTAIMLEDLSVGMFNGLGHAFSTTTSGSDYFLVAAKMASVDARHAATVRNFKQSGSFAGTDTTNGDGLDTSVRNYMDVIYAIQPFIKKKINITTPL